MIGKREREGQREREKEWTKKYEVLRDGYYIN